MAAPKKPNTAAATATVQRNAQERKAALLREANWICIPPEVAVALPADILARLAIYGMQRGPRTVRCEGHAPEPIPGDRQGS